MIDFTPVFDWNDDTDPDPSDQISYTFDLATDSNFLFKFEAANLTLSAYLAGPLGAGQRYWWKVKAVDRQGAATSSSVRSFFIPSSGDLNMDQRLNVVDVVLEVDIVFRGADPPDAPYLVDVDGNCVADVLDVISLIDYVFRGGPAPGALCG